MNCKGNKLRHHTGIKQKHKKNFSLPYFLTNYLAFTLQLQSQNIHGCFVLSRNDFFRHDIPESIHGLRNMVRYLLHAVGEPLFVHYCVAQQNHHSALIPDSTPIFRCVHPVKVYHVSLVTDCLTDRSGSELIPSVSVNFMETGTRTVRVNGS